MSSVMTVSHWKVPNRKFDSPVSSFYAVLITFGMLSFHFSSFFLFSFSFFLFSFLMLESMRRCRSNAVPCHAFCIALIMSLSMGLGLRSSLTQSGAGSDE